MRFVRDQRCGITGTRALVEVEPEEHHHHHHEHEEHHHEHHTWKDIRALIEGAALPPGVKKRALDIFGRVAQAEAQVHGKAVEEVAFHEVGALDSIIDIVGTAVGLELLAPDKITAGEVELGGGTVRCAHGVLPVPAPATLILCRGLPVRTCGFDREMTTPTGAAILAAVVDEFVQTARFREAGTGYGLGSRELDKPNVLRLSWREEPEEAAGDASSGSGSGKKLWEEEELVLLETNIDDMTGEETAFLMERLFARGALDVTLTPCVMKKGRPGTIVAALSRPRDQASLTEALFRLSSTIGVRVLPVRRCALRREAAGSPGARTKRVFLGDEELRAKVEYEDRARLAREAEREISLAEAEERLRGR